MKLGYLEHTCSQNSRIPLGGVVNWFKHHLKSAHKCSMGFKFQDCASH